MFNHYRTFRYKEKIILHAIQHCADTIVFLLAQKKGHQLILSPIFIWYLNIIQLRCILLNTNTITFLYYYPRTAYYLNYFNNMTIPKHNSYESYLFSIESEFVPILSHSDRKLILSGRWCRLPHHKDFVPKN